MITAVDAIAQATLDQAKPGSIILLHPWYPGREPPLAAVPRIVHGLQDKGYRFVTVNDLIAAQGH